MIVNISLFIIFACLIFVVLSKRIKVHPAAKGIMCVTMVSIIGITAQSKHQYLEVANGGFLLTIAMLVVYVTRQAFKRGSL